MSGLDGVPGSEPTHNLSSKTNAKPNYEQQM